MLKNSPHSIKDNTYCCVPQCYTKASKNPEIRFHRFPGVKSQITKIGPNNQKYSCSRREEWKLVLRIGKELSNRMVVCSRHFNPSDYVKYAYHTAKPQLKVTAVPSQNLPVSCLNDTTDVGQRQTVEKITIDKKKVKKNAKKPETTKKTSKNKNNVNIKKTISTTSSAAEMPNCAANSTASNGVQRKQTAAFVPEYFKSKDYSQNFIAELLIPGDKPFKKNSLEENVCDKNKIYNKSNQLLIPGDKPLGKNNFKDNVSDKNEIYNNKSNQVVIKEEPPWADGYFLNENIAINNEKEHGAHNQIPIKKELLGEEDHYSENIQADLDKEDKEQEESNNGHVQNNSTLSRIKNSCKEKNSRSIISEREKLFGLLLASEISALRENTELYIKTKQAIVNTIADAQMQLLTGEGNII